MAATEADVKLCAVCSTESSMACGNCKKVSYCSKEHQKSDWKAHKVSCYPAKIETRKTVLNEEPLFEDYEDEDHVDRVLVATRKISAGEIIFKEKPLVAGPRVHDSYSSGSGFDTSKFPVCLGCFKIVRGEYKCSCCAWPVCNEACEKVKQHSNFECQLFSRRSIPPISPKDVEDYVSICIIRCLLLQEIDPKKWEQLMDLDPHDPEAEFAFLQVARHHAVFINDVCKLNYDIKIISLVSTILRRERRTPEDSDDFPDARMGSFVYYLGCRLSHSCVPNSMWFIKKKTSDFLVRASTDIKRGEVITAASVELGDGTLRRRTNLMYSKIYCTCERCRDPTELGTYMSGVRCQVCKEGWLLSIDPMTLTSDWRCDNQECLKIEEGRKVYEVVETMETQLKSVLFSGSRDLRHIRALESALKKWEGSRVHANHYILTRFKMRMIGMIISISIDLKEVDRDEMESKLVIWTRQCLNLADVYWPGYTRYRGQLIYFLQRGLFCLIFTELERLGKSRRPTSYTQGRLLALREAFLEVLKLRKEGIKILDIEAEGGSEHNFAQEMKQEGYDFESVRQTLKVTDDLPENQARGTSNPA